MDTTDYDSMNSAELLAHIRNEGRRVRELHAQVDVLMEEANGRLRRAHEALTLLAQREGVTELLT
jgi:hypothetical protein